ncbi:BTB/POZ domain containing protein [Acanthamoeba castellanii str. Neff]|uniref:BTB/POZ domain containing protein n=1 Tax=Acanthamoeba castellanii (strain ATCC 30010 / Neff) TaxID=1257118 RepID=L8GVX1_ACACF|nr:BTB/POZ domain containing protein [Acanthamoeba castellanii str. Neff]ELR17140.1 BTB/POZ domain containing protein [Acanthamoeba castellanii str. Neff]
MSHNKSRKNYLGPVGFTSIWEAVKAGNAERVKMHLSGRNSINLNGVQNGCTPLYLAAQNNKPAMIRLLAKESVNPNIHCQGYSPLGIAAMNGRAQALRFGFTECVKELLELRANPNSTDLPLHAAAYSGFASVAEVLLQNGASLDKKDDEGRTPLMLALIHGHEKVAELILQKGLKQGMPSVNDKTNLPPTSVYNTQDYAYSNPNCGRAALHFAAEFEGGRHLVELLLSPSLAVDVNVTDRFGRTPLHLALATNHGTEIAKRLLKEPAIDVTLTDEKMRLPLHIACTKGGHEVVSALVDLAPHLINAKDEHGATPLHRAINNGHDNIALHLIKRNADIKARNVRDQTPFDGLPKGDRLQMLEECYQSFQEGLLNTLNDEKLSDVAIHLEGGSRVILCSRLVLFARSAYWRKVLLEKEAEAEAAAAAANTSEGGRLEIVVNEGRYEVFHAMLYYLYTDNIQFPQLAALAAAPHPGLKPADAEARRAQERNNFLSDVLVMAERYGETRLHELCSQAIDSDTLRSLERRRKRVDAARRLLVSHFSSDMKKMLNNKRYSDVIFSIEGKIVYAHKVILCSRNEFFKAMLLGPWAKEKCTEEDPILITDTPYHIFYSVVEFSYTGDCPQIEPDTVVDLYQASHQYMLLELRKRCENIIEEAVGVDNAVPIYELGHIYEDVKMKEKALAFITQDADTFQLISANSAFSDLPEHLLVDIYRELLVRIGGFSASTTDALVTQENNIPGMVVAVRWLLQNGANPNQKGRRGYPLHIATRGGDISTVRALLDQPGLLVNIADPATGETALHIACGAGHENIAFLLIERNGDVNAHDKRRRTPLELIAETNHTFATDFKEHRELSKIKFGQALNDPAFSDIVITNGDARYYCHQAIEDSSRSEDITLAGGHVPVVEIEGVQEQTIAAFLRYVYTDEVEIDLDNVYEMMGLSMMYPVTGLLALCERANDPTTAPPPEASTMAVDFVSLFNQEKFADVRFIFDPPTFVDTGGGDDPDGDLDEEWKQHMPSFTPAELREEPKIDDDHDGEDEVVVIHAHRAIIATRSPLLLTHFPELKSETTQRTKDGKNEAVVEIDMRRWTMPQQRGKSVVGKNEASTKNGKSDGGSSSDEQHNYYASFFVFLRFLYSGVMSLPATVAAGDRSPDAATTVRSNDEEAELYREILGLGELLGVKALVRQVQPKVDEEERRRKKAHLLTSAF